MDSAEVEFQLFSFTYSFSCSKKDLSLSYPINNCFVVFWPSQISIFRKNTSAFQALWARMGRIVLSQAKPASSYRAVWRKELGILPCLMILHTWRRWILFPEILKNLFQITNHRKLIHLWINIYFVNRLIFYFLWINTGKAFCLKWPAAGFSTSSESGVIVTCINL